MSEIKCITLDGQVRLIQSDRLILRRAAYALIVNDGKLLLLKLRSSGKYHLSGGGIKIGERMHNTLIRESREETGNEIVVDRFAHFEELFFYYDPSGKAYHGLHFYFVCTPGTVKLIEDNLVDDGSAGQPHWVEIQDLHPQDFQIHGDLIMDLIKDGNAA